MSLIRGTAKSQKPNRLDHARSVFDSIRRIVRVLRLTARHTEQAFGLSAAQLFVLHKLAEESSLTPSELAARTLTDLSSISVVTAGLWIADMHCASGRAVTAGVMC